MREATNEILAQMRRRRRKVIQGFLWSLLAVVLLTIALNAILLGTDALSLEAHASNLLFCAVIVAALLLNRRDRFVAALGIIVALVLYSASYPLLMTGAAGNELSLFLYFIPVVLSGLLLGRRALFAVGTMTILVVLLSAQLKRTGMLLSGAPATEPNWSLVLQFVLVLGIVLFFLDRFGSSLNEALVAMAERELALKREMTERQAAQDRLGMALTAGRMATYDTDWTTRQVSGSENLESLYGLPTTNQPRPLADFLELVHPEDREVLLPAEAGGEQGRTESLDQFRVVRPDGELHWLTSVSKAILDAEGQTQRVAGVVIDTTETRAAQLALEELNESLERRVAERTQRLEAANRELETFAYSVSHDLRAPLRGIAGFSQILAEEYSSALDEEARGYLDRIRTAADRMGELIDDLLKLSRISGTEVVRQPVDLGAMASEIAGELNERSAGPPVDLEVEGSVIADGDPKLLRIVMENILGNAWKFMGDQGSPRVVFGCSREGEANVYFVRDNGVGFDMAYSSKLFVPFQRLQEPGRFEGSGIGLATVQRIIHRHGGEIWATSAPGEGATFSFTLEPKRVAVARG